MKRRPALEQRPLKDGNVSYFKKSLVAATPLVLLALAASPAAAQQQPPQQQKPNILFIMGDDIGWMQVGAYHRGIGLGETPNIDRLAREGAMFTTYYAMQSCTSGRNVFFTGMYPLRTGMIPPQLPGSPSYLRPGTPAIAKFLLDLGYTTGEFGKNHLGDHTAALPMKDDHRLSGLHDSLHSFRIMLDVAVRSPKRHIV
jgi:arylsulfatase A-like enzyme